MQQPLFMHTSRFDFQSQNPQKDKNAVNQTSKHLFIKAISFEPAILTFQIQTCFSGLDDV